MRKILVIEDNASIALGLETELSNEGYKVELARDGESGLKCALIGNYDLILLDLYLPRKGGYEVCRELRKAGNRTPIVMVTARTQEGEKLYGFEVGADDYVTKPFSTPELRARIKALLHRSGSDTAGEVYRFGNVEVDMKKAEVRVDTVPIEMTALEYKLLVKFIRSRGQILTREQLLNEIWASDKNPIDRVIDNHVMNLRRKLDPGSPPCYLVNIRGLGYRFDG